MFLAYLIEKLYRIFRLKLFYHRTKVNIQTIGVDCNNIINVIRFHNFVHCLIHMSFGPLDCQLTSKSDALGKTEVEVFEVLIAESAIKRIHKNLNSHLPVIESIDFFFQLNRFFFLIRSFCGKHHILNRSPITIIVFNDTWNNTINVFAIC